MGKSKGQTVNLLYTNKKTGNKTKNTTKPKNRTVTKKNNDRINLDNEIIIGLTPKSEEIKKQVRDKRQKAKRNDKIKKDKSNLIKKNQENIDKRQVQNNRNIKKIKNEDIKKKKNLKMIKLIFIIIILITSIILFMMSSIFNIKQIIVINNSKIPSEEIINLSKLTTGVNMFKTTKGTIKNNIKTNAYVEDVNIKRNINGIVTLDIKERKPTYMIKFANKFVYINNQGYMLETSEDSLKVPIITGFSTPNEEIKVGNRLNVDDLNKLEEIIKIIEVAKNVSLEGKNNTLASIITQIDISNNSNYKLTLQTEGKTVQLGELKELNVKLGRIAIILKQEKGKKGQIYFQDGVDDKIVFREEISR